MCCNSFSVVATTDAEMAACRIRCQVSHLSDAASLDLDANSLSVSTSTASNDFILR